MDVESIVIIGNINSDFRKLTKTPWLIQQFPCYQINGTMEFVDKVHQYRSDEQIDTMCCFGCNVKYHQQYYS